MLSLRVAISVEDRIQNLDAFSAFSQAEVDNVTKLASEGRRRATAQYILTNAPMFVGLAAGVASYFASFNNLPLPITQTQRFIGLVIGVVFGLFTWAMLYIPIRLALIPTFQKSILCWRMIIIIESLEPDKYWEDPGKRERAITFLSRSAQAAHHLPFNFNLFGFKRNERAKWQNRADMVANQFREYRDDILDPNPNSRKNLIAWLTNDTVLLAMGFWPKTRSIELPVDAYRVKWKRVGLIVTATLLVGVEVVLALFSTKLGGASIVLTSVTGLLLLASLGALGIKLEQFQAVLDLAKSAAGKS